MQTLFKQTEKSRKRGGFYWVEDKPYLTPTQILDVLDKKGLMYWFGKKVYYAMVANPNLSEKEALAAPYKENEEAKSRGSTVHSVVEVWKQGKVKFAEWLEGIDEFYRGYGYAFSKFVSERGAEVLDQEKFVLSEKERFAGTLDLICSFDKGNGLSIGDVKTGRALYPTVKLQLSAYKLAYEEMTGKHVSRIFGVLLKPDGTYLYEEYVPEVGAFLALKKVYEYVNSDLLKEVGYHESKNK